MRNLKGEFYINSCDSSGNQIQETDLEKEHWFEVIPEFTVIEGETPYYTAVEGQPSKLIRKVSYLKRVYRVKAPICPFCQLALDKELIKKHGDRLRVMSKKVGLAHRCFSGFLRGSDYTEIYSNTDAPSFHLISETLIDKETIFKLYLENKVDWIRDYGICLMIEERLGINL